MNGKSEERVFLVGHRVSIRRVAWDDLPTICAWLNSPTIMREVRAEKLKPTLEQMQSDSGGKDT